MTTKVRVTICGLNLVLTILNGKEGHIQSSTAEIKDENVAYTLALLSKTVGHGSGHRLVNEIYLVEACNVASIFGGLSL